MPHQGLIVDWKRTAAGWTALVAYHHESKMTLIIEWVRASELWPIASDPNERGRFTGTEEPNY